MPEQKPKATTKATTQKPKQPKQQPKQQSEQKPEQPEQKSIYKKILDVMKKISRVMPEQKSIYKKILDVIEEISRVEKKGHNNFHNYDYVKEADLIEAVRNLLIKNNLIILNNILKTQEVEHKTKKGETEYLTKVKVKYTIIDTETGEKIDLKGFGAGQDSGDKGLYKALTGSMKYFLMKNFLIASDDDPEKDTKKQNYAQNYAQKPIQKDEAPF